MKKYVYGLQKHMTYLKHEHVQTLRCAGTLLCGFKTSNAFPPRTMASSPEKRVEINEYKNTQ